MTETQEPLPAAVQGAPEQEAGVSCPASSLVPDPDMAGGALTTALNVSPKARRVLDVTDLVALRAFNLHSEFCFVLWLNEGQSKVVKFYVCAHVKHYYALFCFYWADNNLIFFPSFDTFSSFEHQQSAQFLYFELSMNFVTLADPK